MNLFCLLPPGEPGEGARFFQAARTIFPPDKIELFPDVSSFAERLHKPRDPSSALLVIGPSSSDLERLAALRESLKEARILLVLADGSDATIALAHRTLPTYISYLDNGTAGVANVLKRVLEEAGAKT